MKSPLIKRLHEDHINYARLLGLLEAKLLQSGTDGEQTYLEMYLIMNYMTHYPDLFHHPYEDIIFHELHGKEADLDSEIDALLHEHRLLHDLGQTLLVDLDAVLNDHIVPRQTLTADLARYADTLRRHMNREEGVVFPAIVRLLGPADWERISLPLESVRDPLFGGVVEERYRSLYQGIERDTASGRWF